MRKIRLRLERQARLRSNGSISCPRRLRAAGSMACIESRLGPCPGDLAGVLRTGAVLSECSEPLRSTRSVCSARPRSVGFGLLLLVLLCWRLRRPAPPLLEPLNRRRRAGLERTGPLHVPCPSLCCVGGGLNRPAAAPQHEADRWSLDALGPSPRVRRRGRGRRDRRVSGPGLGVGGGRC